MKEKTKENCAVSDVNQSRQWVNRSWVNWSNGSQFWMGHMGHGPQYNDPRPITLICCVSY